MNDVQLPRPLPHILVIGGLNYDIKAKLHEEVAHLNDSNSGLISQHDGGVARNIAEVLGRLELPTKLISVFGDDHASQSMKQNLEKQQIDVSDAIFIENMRADTYISFHDHTGELLMAVNQMAVIKEITPSFIHTKIETICQAAIVVCDCNLSAETLQEIASLNRQGILVIDGVSTAKIRRIEALSHKIDLLKLSRLEAVSLCDAPSETSLEGLITKVRDKGVKQVLVSDGEKGFAINDGTSIHHFDAIKATPQTVTGAGDCLLAGIIYGIATGMPLSKAGEIGRKTAYLSTKSVAAVNHHINLDNILIDDLDSLTSGGSF